MNIKQLASKLSVSSPAIIQHLKKNRKRLKHHVKKIKNQRIFDNAGIKIIEASFKHKSIKHNSSVSKFNALILKSYQKRINELKNEVASQNNHLTRLEDLLNQQQELNLNTQRELTYRKHSWLWRLFH